MLVVVVVVVVVVVDDQQSVSWQRERLLLGQRIEQTQCGSTSSE
jgi:hypothetical protein